jgi:hypothetical protein
MITPKINKYGLTIKEHSDLIEIQNNKCAICGDFQLGKSLHIDHCHITGNVRGLLCTKCNVGLGLFRDNIDYLLTAIMYLDKSKLSDNVKQED